MSSLKFRALHADEIDVRVQSVVKGGCILLLYKDARVDMCLLDEVVGPMHWQRDHLLINNNLYCRVSIWDEKTEQWISKCDVGTESNTEATKGEASDSFKRACFNWGIGRELYTSPFIYVSLTEQELVNGKLSPKVKFSVKAIEYTEQDGKRTISKLVIVDNKDVDRYTFGAKKQATPQQQPKAQATPAPQQQVAPKQKPLLTSQKVFDLSFQQTIFAWLDKWRNTAIQQGESFETGDFLSQYYDFDSEGTKQELLGYYTNHLSTLI